MCIEWDALVPIAVSWGLGEPLIILIMPRVSLLFVIWLIYLVPTQQEDSAVNLAVIGISNDTNTTFIDEHIPKGCEELGFCEESNRYPRELAENLIQKLKETDAIVDSDVSNIPEFGSRSGFDDNFLTNLCTSQTKTVAPLMVRGLVDGKWYYSLNSKDNFIQSYNVQVCTTTNSTGAASCSEQLILSNQYKSQCIQKFMTRKLIVIRDRRAHTILVNIPCCCTCVAVNKYLT